MATSRRRLTPRKKTQKTTKPLGGLAIFSVSDTARRALALEQAGSVKVLFWLVLLMGWLFAMLTAASLGVQLQLNQWRTTQLKQLTLYLPYDTSAQESDDVLDVLLTYPDVNTTRQQSRTQVEAQLGYIPELDSMVGLPLPQVIDLEVATAEFDGENLRQQITEIVPDAMLTDRRQAVQSIVQSVRFVQLGAFVLQLLIAVVLAITVSLSVVAGLRALARNLSVLQVVGATDSFLSQMVIRRVLINTVMGAGVAAGAAVVLTLLLQMWLHVSWQAVLLPSLAVGVFSVVLLPVLAAAVAGIQTKQLLKLGLDA